MAVTWTSDRSAFPGLARTASTSTLCSIRSRANSNFLKTGALGSWSAARRRMIPLIVGPPLRPFPHPEDPVMDDFQVFLLVEDRKRLVTGSIVEDPSLSQGPAASRPELLALVPRLEEDDRVGFGDREELVVHLGLLD